MIFDTKHQYFYQYLKRLFNFQFLIRSLLSYLYYVCFCLAAYCVTHISPSILCTFGSQFKTSVWFWSVNWRSKEDADMDHSSCTFDDKGWSQDDDHRWKTLSEVGLGPTSFYSRRVAPPKVRMILQNVVKWDFNPQQQQAKRCRCVCYLAIFCLALVAVGLAGGGTAAYFLAGREDRETG